MTIWNKSTISALVLIVVIFIISFIARPVIYIGGLFVLEIVKPRTVFFTGPPDRVWGNGFEVTADVPCNKLFERNVYVIFEPPLLFVDKMNELQGDVLFRLHEDTSLYDMPIVPLGERRSMFDSRIAGLVAVGFPEYPVLGGFKCKEQQVYLKLDELNFDPREYEISIIIQRIGIDG